MGNKEMKRPRSIFCKRLPLGDDKRDRSYRKQEYITEALFIVLILLIALRILERNTSIMAGVYGGTYIALNIVIDVVLLVASFLLLNVFYESKIKRFKIFLDSNPERREQVETEDENDRKAEEEYLRKKQEKKNKKK